VGEFSDGGAADAGDGGGEGGAGFGGDAERMGAAGVGPHVWSGEEVSGCECGWGGSAPEQERASCLRTWEGNLFGSSLLKKQSVL